MWNIPTKERLDRIPRLYETENTPLRDKLIYLHLFIGNCDWYIAEYDGDNLFWGYVILNGDMVNSEWGYISFSELKNVRVDYIEVDCDLYWKVRPAGEIEGILR